MDDLLDFPLFFGPLIDDALRIPLAFPVKPVNSFVGLLLRCRSAIDAGPGCRRGRRFWVEVPLATLLLHDLVPAAVLGNEDIGGAIRRQQGRWLCRLIFAL